MAERSAISWTRSTFNPWIGCTKVGPGCDHCYAEALDNRMQYGGATHWGDDKPRHRTGIHNWNNPARWDKAASIEKQTGVVAKADWHTPGFWPVFCASLADVFDNQVPPDWRLDLWETIEATRNLSWLLVTKRIGNVRAMVPRSWLVGDFPHNVRILITVVNQEEADRDIPKLLALDCKNGISYEPAIGPVDWAPWLGRHQSAQGPIVQMFKPRLEWIIVGGESTQGSGKARPFTIEWAGNTVTQGKAAGVPVFVKQFGSNPVDSRGIMWGNFKDRAGADPAEWPEDLRVQEFPA